MFFTQNGVYKFNQDQLREAHQWCQDQIDMLMTQGTESVAVSNTFTEEWEMQPYRDMAEKHGYTVFTISCENNFESVHNVPESVIVRMNTRWSNYYGITQKP